MIYDVSMPIYKGMQVYKNKEEKKPVIEAIRSLTPHFTQESVITMNLHTGTHLDFPRHMLKEGTTSTGFDSKVLIRNVKVFDVTRIDDHISQKDLEVLDIQRDDFILFKTKNSLNDHFDFNFIYIDEQASSYLASLHIAGVGVDGLGVERAQSEHPTHMNLMHANILIIEGLRLAQVKEGTYFMVALGLNILEVDAIPLRVLLYDSVGEIN
jgi:arylformamidase